jgi:hypothetical protein
MTSEARQTILGAKRERVNRGRPKSIGPSGEARVAVAIGGAGAFEQHTVVFGLD